MLEKETELDLAKCMSGTESVMTRKDVLNDKISKSACRWVTLKD